MESNFDFRMNETELRLRRNWNGFIDEISWVKRRRDRRRFRFESFGDMNAPADGRRFLVGKASVDIAMILEDPKI